MEFEKREIFENLSGIYCIVNKINNKVYIGQTKQKFVKRYWHHLWCLRKNKHDNRYLQKSFNKYGEQNFKFIVIHVLCTCLLYTSPFHTTNIPFCQPLTQK